MSKIRCLFDDMVDVGSLQTHPKNRNKHPDDQIRRLADILQYQGWRYPIKVSKRSGLITAGHGRLAAAKLLGLQQVPVNYQDYDSEEMEYADLVADNAVALWAEIDLAGINADLGDLGPSLNIDLLGLKNFTVEPLDRLNLPAPEASGASGQVDGSIARIILFFKPEVYRELMDMAMGLISELGIDDMSQLFESLIKERSLKT